MSESHSTSRPASGKTRRSTTADGCTNGKPAKPYPDFPLTAHPAGYWCKKIRGKLHYFGPWADPDGALAKYLEQKDALHAGKKPREDATGTTVKVVVNTFLASKKALVEAGELSRLTWNEYKLIADELIASLGKGRLVADLDPADFAKLRNKLAKRWGPHRMRKAVQYTRCIFKHAYENGSIDRPVRFGPDFKRPTMKTMRLHRAAQGERLFSAAEVHQLLDAAGVQLRAMLLLGINAGLGNSDVANLPLSAVNLETAWLDFPRPKTGVARRCPLWPETVQALRAALATRPTPKNAEHAELFFVTKYGGPWASKEVCDSPITKETRKLLNGLGINGHRNFYTLRHTFRTVGDESRDQPACDYIMGHADPTMAGHYRERIGDTRLQAVSEHVRSWLYGPAVQSH